MKGRLAEHLAALFLRLKGYRILARGYRRPVGEVDIIARRGTVLVAVEVKSRPTLDAALHALHNKQRRRIARAMEAYQGSHADCADLDIRFDVVLVTSLVKVPVHLENAW
ncbi:UPF0102 protein [Sneathiella chinensis]|uniref:UPF0102 protein GCM10007924_04950 n=1 Tax=Sneathiella chinensis TaxID=349750 RepID=A0ABQ5U1W5_9PROT|nr:UPF0102 protein [Sneathiella chinensis]